MWIQLYLRVDMKLSMYSPTMKIDCVPMLDENQTESMEGYQSNVDTRHWTRNLPFQMMGNERSECDRD